MQTFFGGEGTGGGGANKVYYGDVQMMNMTYTYVKKCCFGNGSLGIRHWAFGNADLTAMICFSDHQTTASQCAMQ